MLFSKYKIHQVSCLKALIAIIEVLKSHQKHQNFDKTGLEDLLKQVKDKSLSQILNNTMSDTKVQKSIEGLQSQLII